jgi:membrane associated rhomboid family serine protease
MVGASGAVAGVLGAYMMLHPRRRMLILLMRTIPLRLHVALILVIWIAFQVGAGIWFTSQGETDTAWWAHVGGFVVGMVLILFMRSRGVTLFDRVSDNESNE